MPVKEYDPNELQTVPSPSGGNTDTPAAQPSGLARGLRSAFDATGLPGLYHAATDAPTEGESSDPALRGGMRILKGIASPVIQGIKTAREGVAEHNLPKVGTGAISAIPVLGPMVDSMEEHMSIPAGDTNNGYLHRLGQTFSPENIGTAAGTIGTAAATEGLTKVPAIGRAARTAAIGDTDAAALRGLQIGPKSDAQLSTLNSVGKSRPYLKGATSQADMQARLPLSMNEVWKPYSDAVDAIGNRSVKGPDGMTTVRELEAERMRLSALNRGVKSGNPSDIQQAMQEGRTPAQLIERESQVQNALDPHLASTGIDPKAIRDTYGALADVRGGVEGKTTLNEKPKPSGFGRMLNMSYVPKTWIGEPAQGLRDIVAGRPLWSAKPTDLGIREGFATGGPKPDLGTLKPPNLQAPRPQGLPAPKITMPRPPEVGGTPEGYRPPPFRYDTTPMRKGRLLPEPQQTTTLHGGGEVAGTPSRPITLNQFDKPAPRGLPVPRRTIPMSSHADIFPDQLPGGSTQIPAIKTGGPTKGLGYSEYVGQVPGERGGVASPKGTLLRRGKTIEGKK